MFNITMPNLISASPQSYIGLPYDSMNWIGLLIAVGILVWLVRRTWDLNLRMSWQKWALLLLLALSTFLVGQLLVFHLEIGNFLPLPGVPVDTAGLAIFSLA